MNLLAREEARRERTLALGTFLLLAVAVWVVYGRALDAPFIFDDTASIATNPSIRTLWPPFGEAENPGPLNPPRDRPTGGRPLVNLTFALNYHLGHLRPAGYRVFNLAVHVLSAAVLASIVRRTLRLDYFAGRWDRAAWPLSFVVAVVWALHPLGTEAVVYVTQRTELLMALCYLATLWAALRYWAAASATARIGWLGVATLACLAGMASKEVMVSAPLVVLLFERTFRTGGVRRSWPLYVGLTLGWGLLFVLNVHGPRSGSAGFGHGVPPHVWWLTQAKVLLLYLELAVWPWPLSIHYPKAYLSTLEAAWPWLATVTVLATGTFVLLWRRHPVGFVAAAVGLILSPTLVVPIVTEVAAERRMYLPLAGLTALAIVGGYRTIPMRRLSVVAASTLILVSSLVTVRRLAAYRTPLTIWQDAVVHQPDDAVAHDSLGKALLEDGRPEEAIVHFEQALRLEPGDSMAHNNLGAALTRIGRPRDAIGHLQQALALEPHEPKSKAHMNLGNALLQIGDAREAIAHLEEAVRLQPDDADAHYNLGGALLTAGRPEDAIRHFEQAIRLAPDDAQAYSNMANALLKTGRPEKAAEYYRHALALEPDFIVAHSNLGAALLELNRAQEAVEQFERVLRLQPDHANAHYNLGSALLGTGRPREAAEHFEQAIRLGVDDASVHFNCAIAYAASDRTSEAIAKARTALALARERGETALAQAIDEWLASHRAAP